jgi:hypothetical protein
MRPQPAFQSDIVEISKLNGDFCRNYGRILGAVLYLRSISIARSRPLFWTGLTTLILSIASVWFARGG